MAILSGVARLRACVRAGIAAWLVMAAPLLCAQSGVPEYQLKAIFLFNFTQFVEWPANAFADASAPLIIGVLGDDPFGASLDQTVRGEKANGRSLVIQRYRVVAEIDSCHILFVSRSERSRLETIFRALRGRSILTVSDLDDFARSGGMVQFRTENNRVRLRINLEVAKAAQLTISSKLLRSVDVLPPGNK
jgi:hypothetical protein